MYTDFLTIVLDQLALGIIEVQGLGGLLGDQYHIEAAVLEHAGELALASTEGYGTGGVIVGDIDGGILALLVVIVGTFVLVELEAAILTSIDIQVNQLCGFLIAPLHLRTEGDDGARTDKYWYLFVRSIYDEPAA